MPSFEQLYAAERLTEEEAILLLEILAVTDDQSPTWIDDTDCNDKQDSPWHNCITDLRP